MIQWHARDPLRCTECGAKFEYPYFTGVNDTLCRECTERMVHGGDVTDSIFWFFIGLVSGGLLTSKLIVYFFKRKWQ